MKVYLDYNATAPLRPEVRSAIEPILFDSPAAPSGNASSVHWAGQVAKRRLEDARSRVAALLARKPSEIVFTSGGTEADNLALSAVLRGKKRLVLTAVEHPAVLESAAALAKRGADVIHVGVDANGQLDLAALEHALATPTELVSIMAVNNETGVISPIDRAIELAKAAGAKVHVDAVQGAGRVPLPIAADLISISGHKLGGLPGTGVLALSDSVRLEPTVLGGAQERGRRAGTESVAGAVALSIALETAIAGSAAESARLAALGDRIEAGILALPGTRILGAGAPRVAGVTCALFAGVDREALLQALDLEGIAASSGSACASGSVSPSHVLLAMGVPAAEALSALRFSLGWGTTEAHVARLLEVLPKAVAQVRAARVS